MLACGPRATYPSDWTERDWRIIGWAAFIVIVISAAFLGWKFLVAYLKSNPQSFLYRAVAGRNPPPRPHRPLDTEDNDNDRA